MLLGWFALVRNRCTHYFGVWLLGEAVERDSVIKNGGRKAEFGGDVSALDFFFAKEVVIKGAKVGEDGLSLPCAVNIHIESVVDSPSCL